MRVNRSLSLYDVVGYPGFPFEQTHPDRLATIATLVGMNPAPVEKCRVLELACGDGGNLIPMAAGLPGGTFVGVDLAKAPIAAGKRMAKALGLRNVRLVTGDIMDIGLRRSREWGEFDYVIAHGLYAWVPAAVRDRILRIVRGHLAPQGVAFVSYNALPGGRLRQIMREMMLYRTRGIENPVERAVEGRAFLGFLATAAAKPDSYHEFLAGEFAHMSGREPWALFHDELAEVYAPVYFHDFVAHAGKHRLQYVAEANYHDSSEAAVAEAARPAFAEMAENWVDREQYLDFVKCRRFRQTLLCREEVKLDRNPQAEVCRGMFVSSRARAVSEEPDFTPGVVEEFEGPRGARMKTGHPLAKLALAQLIGRWPASVGFDELEAVTRVMADEDGELERVLWGMFSGGLIEFHRYRVPVAAGVGERPRAGRVARYQAAEHLAAGRFSGALLTSLRHASVEAHGEFELELVRLLDGTRDRAALTTEVGMRFEGRMSGRQVARGVKKSLGDLARSGLLERCG